MEQAQTIEQLQRLIQEQARQLQEATQQREEETLKRHEAEQKAEEALLENRKTTLKEYMTACHQHVFSRLIVETDRALTSKGTITNPRNKLVPTRLVPWSDFINLQRTTLGKLFDLFPEESRVLENVNFLRGLGDRIGSKKIADEKRLEYFQHLAVEDPVARIMQQLKTADGVKRAFNIGEGVIFENHPQNLSETSTEVIEAIQAQNQNPTTPPRTPPRIPGQRSDGSLIRPDQICVYRSDEDDNSGRTMLYVSEYKAPHKLTAPQLRAGLRSMDIYKEVVNRKTIPTTKDEQEYFQYHAERLTASAITQTYHYMIEGGLDHSLLTTGEATVFLKIDWKDPATLYFHLAEPGPEALAHPSAVESCGAVGQYLAFSLMALEALGRREFRGQEQRAAVKASLNSWAEEFETTLQRLPVDARRPPTDSPAYQPETYKEFDRSPYVLRLRNPRPTVTDDHNKETRKRDETESSDDESSTKPPDTPSPTERRSQGTRRSQRILALRPKGNGGGPQDHEYCTQKCLLGLVRGDVLDMNCPNVKFHHAAKGNGSRYHPINHTQWRRLLHKQLQRSLDDGIVPLQKEGARGALFKVTLLAYGYTFIGKGTVSAFIPDLRHEERVYSRLRSLQGVNVPVYLGSIDLHAMNKIYYYGHRVYIVYLMFLSWAGEVVWHVPDKEQAMVYRASAQTALALVHQEGVVHRDVREPNALINVKTGQVMIIDFERAVLGERPRSRRALGPVAPNKRRRSEKVPDQKLHGTINQRHGLKADYSDDLAGLRALWA